MRYLMRQKLFAFEGNFAIQDENGTNVYHIDRQLLSFGMQLSFRDMSGTELCHIQQKVVSLMPTYEIYHGGQLWAVVRKNFTILRDKLTIEIPGQASNVEVQGNFWDYEYTFNWNGRALASVSKAWFSWTDTYGVDVADGMNPLPYLACTVVVDLTCQHRGGGGEIIDDVLDQLPF